jgi:hypothetical protein
VRIRYWSLIDSLAPVRKPFGLRLRGSAPAGSILPTGIFRHHCDGNE